MSNFQYETCSALNEFMCEARHVAETQSLDLKQKVGCIIVSESIVVGRGANGSSFHLEHGCERKRLGCKSGEGYELCEGCHPRNHAEPTAIADAISSGLGHRLEGSAVYMWGHWYCCSECIKAMRSAGITHVYLPNGAEGMFK